MDEDVRCPNCGTTKYANVNLKMMVNVCGHRLCESCVELLFAKGAGKCPTCDTTLKRFAYRFQLYDDESVEKDLDQRRRLQKDINLKEEDFDTLREYNDFLELFETFVYNLANGIDVDETKQRIEDFKSENSSKLTKKRNKVSKDLEFINQILEEEKEAQNSRNTNINTTSDNQLAALKIAERKKNLLDDLFSSDLPAEMILRSFQKQTEQELAAINESETKRQQQLASVLAAKRKQKLTFSTGITSGTTTFDEEMHDVEAIPYVYLPPKYPNDGPACPTPRTIVRYQYLAHTRQANQAEIAGGFSSLYPCQRALQEAITDLTFLS